MLYFSAADNRRNMKGPEMNINDVNVYKVEIVETLRREITVAALSEEDAVERAESMIASGEISLDDDDSDGHEVRVTGEVEI